MPVASDLHSRSPTGASAPAPARSALAELLFPAAERQFRGLRWLRMTLRTGHIATFGVVVGGHVFGAEAAAIYGWLIAAIITGAALIGLNLYQSCLWLREVRGAVIMAKLLALCVIPFWWEARVPILFAVIAASSYISHMPGRYRYWVIGRGPRAHKARGLRG